MKIEKSKTISLIQILLGAVLLTREIYHFMILPSGKEDIMGGLVTLYKYKENTYSNIFMFTILLVTGVSFWINKRYYWVLNHILLGLISGIIILFIFIEDVKFMTPGEFNIIIIIFLIQSSLYIVSWRGNSI